MYACKSFENNNYLNGKKRKLELLSDIEDKNLLLPKYWTKDKNDNVILSARNIPTVKTTMVNSINVYDILKYDSLVMTKDAVAAIEEVYA